MAKFCGKCGARLDEATGLCPNCDADKMSKDSIQSQPSEAPEQVQADKRASEKPLSGKDSKKKSKSERRAQKKAAKKEKRAQWSTGKKIRRVLLKFIFAILLLVVIAAGTVGTLVYFDVMENPAIEKILNQIGLIFIDQTTITETTNETILVDFTANENYFWEDEQHNVTFSVLVEQQRPDFVDLYSEDKVVSQMFDNGTNGDLVANDGIYSCTISVLSDFGSVSYYSKLGEDCSDLVYLYFFEKPTEQSISETKQFQKEIAAIEKTFCNDLGYVEESNLRNVISEVEKYAQKLYENGDILYYESSISSVLFKFKNGVTYLYMPKRYGIDAINDNTNISVLTLQPCLNTYSSDINDFLMLPDLSAEQICNILKAYSFQSENNYDNHEVTLELIKSFSKNQVVIWHGHGGYTNSLHSYLLTGEDFDWNAWWWDPIYCLDSLQNRIVECSNGNVAFTSKYIEKYCEDLDGSFFYLAACQSGKDSRLADSFIKKGAEAVVANSETIYTIYNLQIQNATLANMTQLNNETGNLYTLSEALVKAKEKHGENDGAYGDKEEIATPLIFGGENADNFTFTNNTSNIYDQVPSDAVEFNDHYYYVYDIDTITDWNMAQEYCEAQGGYLATITSPEEDAFLYSYITDAGYSSVMFGLTDQEQTDDWRWVTGEEFSYQNWRSGEPNHQGGYEHYGMYYGRNIDGTWNDGSGRGGPFLCEWGEYNVESNEIWLDELAIIDSDRYDGNMGDSFIGKIGTRNGRIDIEGNDYEHGLEAWIARWNYKNESSWAWCVYDLEEKYATLSGVIGILETSYNKTNFDTTLEIWGDNKLLYSYNLYPGMSNEMVSLNVEGVRKLKISVFDNKSVSGGTAFVLGNFKLCKDGQPMDNQLNVKDSLRYEMREEVIDFSTSDGIVVIKSHIQYPYFTDGSTCAQLLNKRYADFIKSYKERDDDYDAYYSDIVDSGETHLLPFYDDVTIEVTYNKNGYISLKETTSSFTGGAHAYGEEKTLTLRLVDGKIMGCLDFLEGEDNLCDQLLKKYYTESIGYYPQGYGVGADAPFVLTQEGLCIFYDGGDSLPATSFTIPYTQMGSCIISVNALLDTKLLTNQAEDSSLVELSDYLYDDTVINVASAVGDMQVGSTEKFAEYAEGDKLIIAILAGETEDYYNQITDIKNTGNMLVTLYGIKIGDSIETVRKALSLENAGFYDPDESKDKQGNRVLTFWQGDAACLTTTFSNDCLASYSYELRYTSY